MTIPSSRVTRLAVLLITFTAFAFAGDKEVHFVSTPPGAQVLIDGKVMGTTPTTIKFASYCFGRKNWAFSKYLNRSIQVQFMKEGYTPKTILLTTGPSQFVSLNGQNRFEYYVIPNTEVSVALESVQEFFPPPAQVVATSASANPGSPKLTTEQIAQRAFGSVVVITTSKGSGSGFFITESGVIATNAHVIEDESTATITLSNGKPLQSNAIYADSNRDLALIKVQGTFDFLPINIAPPPPGSEVVAICSPGISTLSLTNTVTKGVVGGWFILPLPGSRRSINRMERVVLRFRSSSAEELRISEPPHGFRVGAETKKATEEQFQRLIMIRASKQRELELHLNKPVSVCIEEVDPHLKTTIWSAPRAAKLVKVTAFYVTLARGEGHAPTDRFSVPLEGVIVNWDDFHDRLEVRLSRNHSHRFGGPGRVNVARL